jgi:hypothetical protein
MVTNPDMGIRVVPEEAHLKIKDPSRARGMGTQIIQMKLSIRGR